MNLLISKRLEKQLSEKHDHALNNLAAKALNELNHAETLRDLMSRGKVQKLRTPAERWFWYRLTDDKRMIFSMNPGDENNIYVLGVFGHDDLRKLL